MACIEGLGFDNNEGGFSAILIDGKEVPKSVIAAAPDLLAALEGLLPLADWALFEQSPPCADQHLVDRANAAVAKARGE